MKELRIAHDQREDHDGGQPARWPWLAAIALLLAALAGAGWWFLGERPLSVQTATAVAPGGAAAAGAVLQATGYVTARRQATVSTQITGTLTEVLIEAGDRVKAGQVIARLEDSALRAALHGAQATVQASQAQVANAQAQLAQAQADAQRQGELVATGMTTRQAAEQARTSLAAATAQLEARRREADAARAQLAQAKVNFDFTVVRAPFAGVVTEKAAQVGEIVSPLSAGGGFTRTGVGTIVDMESLEVDVDVNEAYIGQVSAGMPAEAVLDAYADWRIPAHVVAIVPAADRGKATVRVRVALEQRDTRIVPNMGVRVSFLGRKPPVAAAPLKGVLVPPEALAQRDGATVVFVVADGKAVQRNVTPAAQDVGRMKLVPQGISAGDRLVLAPPAELRDGTRVTVEEANR
ncbi:efflux RND transporter periplasmic adaptor subunit [Piscinibacter sp. XHJ-5]|uniref:efflux RND transporter periplasmic adaptor subunit n=1 Tax=Piscinibacter sp. XHJ-5 TaxID=3037797 RepID=UPI002452B382|nr:efflux RND transporter periplasmic adaptor subunit [Piscinibacter sp. XHJ-5]